VSERLQLIILLVARLVSQVRILIPGSIQGSLNGVDLMVSPILVLFVANLVEDEELGFGTDLTGVGNLGLLEVSVALRTTWRGSLV